MTTRVLGKKIENIYKVDDKKKKTFNEDGELVKEIFTGKPELVKTSEVKEWKELCSFEGEPSYNKGDSKNIFSLWEPYGDRLNISEDETVNINKQIFRADLNELHLYSNKVISEIDVDKKQSEVKLDKLIKEFNETMIESNEKLKAYCEVHKLYKPETDCIELFKVVYPSSEYAYNIEDGKMNAVKISTVKWDNRYIISSDCIDALSISYNEAGCASIKSAISTLDDRLSTIDTCIATCADAAY